MGKKFRYVGPYQSAKLADGSATFNLGDEVEFTGDAAKHVAQSNDWEEVTDKPAKSGSKKEGDG